MQQMENQSNRKITQHMGHYCKCGKLEKHEWKFPRPILMKKIIMPNKYGSYRTQHSIPKISVMAWKITKALVEISGDLLAK